MRHFLLFRIEDQRKDDAITLVVLYLQHYQVLCFWDCLTLLYMCSNNAEQAWSFFDNSTLFFKSLLFKLKFRHLTSFKFCIFFMSLYCLDIRYLVHSINFKSWIKIIISVAWLNRHSLLSESFAKLDFIKMK